MVGVLRVGFAPPRTSWRNPIPWAPLGGRHTHPCVLSCCLPRADPLADRAATADANYPDVSSGNTNMSYIVRVEGCVSATAIQRLVVTTTSGSSYAQGVGRCTGSFAEAVGVRQRQGQGRRLSGKRKQARRGGAGPSRRV
jgi:hypothetical protein